MADRPSRVPLLLAVVAAVVAMGIGGGLALITSDDSGTATGSDRGEPTGSPGTADEQAPADLSQVQEYDDLDPTHTEDDVDYPQSPPVGGPHRPYWLECGVYDEPVPNEVVVHDLEHGAFWFAYDADALTDEDVDALAALLPENGIMSPYEELDGPVVVTVWGRQLALTGPDDPRLPLFLDEFAGGATAPEPYASCAGGMTADQLDDGSLDGTEGF